MASEEKKEAEVCFRCGGRLSLLERRDDLEFLKCVTCERQYSRREGRAITDRWLSPISLALYGIIFQDSPISEKRLKQLAGSLDHLSSDEIGVLIAEIDSELQNPRQSLVDMMDLSCSEEFARDYLRRLLHELSPQKKE